MLPLRRGVGFPRLGLLPREGASVSLWPLLPLFRRSGDWSRTERSERGELLKELDRRRGVGEDSGVAFTGVKKRKSSGIVLPSALASGSGVNLESLMPAAAPPRPLPLSRWLGDWSRAEPRRAERIDSFEDLDARRLDGGDRATGEAKATTSPGDGP